MIQPTKWSVPLGSGADVQDLPDDDLKFASFSKIFPQITQVPLSAGGVAPRRIDFNSLFKLLADNIYYYQNGGVFEYSDTADYEKGALVRYNDNIYLCIQDNSALNVHNPEDIDYWSRFALNNELYDYVIESVVNNDGSWYRKWKSGWVEQGGCVGNTTDTHILNQVVSFLKPFSDYNYTITGSVLQPAEYSASTVYIGLDTAVERSPFFCNRDKTYFKIASIGPNKTVSWYACGMEV